jgi:predicted metal-dependent phosphoesterase TrpH
MFIADFHIHTNQSDGKMNLSDVVDLYGERGFGAIAITDHLCEEVSILGKAARYLGCSLTESNFQKHMDEIQEEAHRAWRQYRMVVLPGFEVTKNSISNHRSAHVLALGTSKYVNPNLPIRDLCRAIRENGGLAIAAHPVSTRRWEKQTYHLWDQRHELAKEFDAWEVASGAHLFPEVLHSGLPMIANSDLHLPHHMTSWKTILQCEREPEAILNSIKRQELQFSFYHDAVTIPMPHAMKFQALPSI